MRSICQEWMKNTQSVGSRYKLSVKLQSFVVVGIFSLDCLFLGYFEISSHAGSLLEIIHLCFDKLG